MSAPFLYEQSDFISDDETLVQYHARMRPLTRRDRIACALVVSMIVSPFVLAGIVFAWLTAVGP